VLCPVCRQANFPGDDLCSNCGADLAGSDLPATDERFEGRLLGEHLDALGVGAPVVVAPTAPVGPAIARMRADRVDCLLVVEAGRLVGILTERDAVLKVAGRPAGSLTVRDVMTPDPVVLRHDDTLAVAINKMAVGGFRHIPIVDDGVPTGVVAAADLFRHLLAAAG
jgi:signal-transduction protein with cAMP-binding, CBS, and nucleotidyltransferase domain